MKSRSRIPPAAILTCTALLCLVAPVDVRAQGRIQGRVIDGTNRRPLPNQEIRLLMPKGGMQQIATASTDENGRFAFTQSGIDPNSFYLLDARFQGVSYNAPAQFDSTGSASVELTVYDSTPSGVSLRILSLRALVRAEGTRARVQEEFDVINASQPPVAYANKDGTFRIRLSPEASKPSVTVVGLMNMPLPQTAEPGKSSGEFYIQYPLKPGLTRVELAYEADYTSSRLSLSDRVPYPIDQAKVYVSPTSLSVDSPILKSSGVDAAHNLQKLEARNLRRNAPLELRLAGEAPAAPQSEADQGGIEVRVVPNSMTRLGVPMLAGLLLVLLWALGVRLAREWPVWKARRGESSAQKQLGSKVDTLVNSLADLDELFAAHKIAESKYWKERLELKAKLVAILKKAPPSLLEFYATRNTAR